MKRPLIATLTTTLLVAVFGACQNQATTSDDKSKTEGDKKEPAASAEPSSTEPQLDPAIAEVVQQAVEQAKGAEPSADSAPPPDGILGLERANKEAALASAPQLTLGKKGSEPYLQLGGPAPNKQKGRLQLAIRTGPQAAMPTTEFQLEVSREKASGDDPESTADGEWVFDVKASGLGGEQPGAVPQAVEGALQKLEGSELSFPVKGVAPVGSPRVKRSKAASEDLDLMMASAADALGSVLAVYPNEPVGKGAVWMVTSREVFMGTDVVAYRLYQVSEMDAAGAVVEVNTKRYAAFADSGLGMPGLEKNMLVQFQGTDEVQLKVQKGAALPVEGRLLQRLSAVVASPSNPQQAAPIQIEVRSVFGFPTGEAPAAAAPGSAAAPTPAAAPPAATAGD